MLGTRGIFFLLLHLIVSTFSTIHYTMTCLFGTTSYYMPIPNHNYGLWCSCLCRSISMRWVSVTSTTSATDCCGVTSSWMPMSVGHCASHQALCLASSRSTSSTRSTWTSLCLATPCSPSPHLHQSSALSTTCTSRCCTTRLSGWFKLCSYVNTKA